MQYDDKCLYVAILESGLPLFLTKGVEDDFHWCTLNGITHEMKTGEDALYVLKTLEVPAHIYAFSDSLEGLTFFYDAYKKFYSKVSP